jgi:hypothetical protein
MLMNGVPNQIGVLGLDEWHYYLYEVPIAQDITVALMTYSGNADLYIANNTVVTTENYTWKSDSH